MSKFWGAVAALFAIGFGLMILGNQQPSGINFKELETECRYSQQESVDVEVGQDSRLEFEGMFPINSTESDLKYNYRVSGGEIILDVYAENLPKPDSYVNDCLGMAIYKAQTDRIPDGRYRLEIQHEGERIEEKVIRFD